jgi:hypothetical protein
MILLTLEQLGWKNSGTQTVMNRTRSNPEEKSNPIEHMYCGLPARY